MVTALCSDRVRTDFGDIQGVMRHVFPAVSEILCVDVVEKCFLCTTGLCRDVYGKKYAPQCRTVRKQRLWSDSWNMVENIGQPMLYNRESRIATCAQVLCYTYLLVNDVLGDSNETEALQAACNMLHIGVPLGLLPKLPQPLVLYIF